MENFMLFLRHPVESLSSNVGYILTCLIEVLPIMQLCKSSPGYNYTNLANPNPNPNPNLTKFLLLIRIKLSCYCTCIHEPTPNVWMI